jgi:hypothetical protein
MKVASLQVSITGCTISIYINRGVGSPYGILIFISMC